MTFRDLSAGYLVNHLARIFARKLDERLEPLGLRPAQFVVMLALAETPGLTQSEIARRIDVEQATMAGTLKRMERDGLITREAMEGDARRRRIALTPEALRRLDLAIAAAKEINAEAMAALGADGDRFISDLQRLIAAMKP
jgi:DNA-binding MarR family transcriptional regulator